MLLYLSRRVLRRYCHTVKNLSSTPTLYISRAPSRLYTRLSRPPLCLSCSKLPPSSSPSSRPFRRKLRAPNFFLRDLDAHTQIYIHARACAGPEREVEGRKRESVFVFSLSLPGRSSRRSAFSVGL